MERDIIETRGVAALRRLYLVACRDSGQCRYIARFLLGLYNGMRFPFDLTDLRAIDAELFDDCMAVLNMDARLTRQEVHTYFDRRRRLRPSVSPWCAPSPVGAHHPRACTWSAGMLATTRRSRKKGAGRTITFLLTHGELK